MALFTSLHQRRSKLLHSWVCTRCGGNVTCTKGRAIQWVPPLLVLAGLGLMALSIPVGALTMVSAFAVPTRDPELECTTCKGKNARQDA